MLHTVNKSPFQNSAMEDCVGFIHAGDTLLLMEDGVYAALPGTSKSHLAEKAMQTCTVCALSADLKARGLDSLIPGIAVIDYDGFVDLVEAHPAQQPWL